MSKRRELRNQSPPHAEEEKDDDSLPEEIPSPATARIPQTRSTSKFSPVDSSKPLTWPVGAEKGNTPSNIEEEDDDSSSEESGSREPDTWATSKTEPTPQTPSDAEEEDDSSEESSSSEPSTPPLAARKPQTPSTSKTILTTQGIYKTSGQNPKAIGNDSDAPDLVTLSAKSTKKRPAEDENEEAMKSNKKKKDLPEASENKPLFVRIWSDEDELAVLRGYIKFRVEKKYDPAGNIAGFLDFIKDDLHIDVSIKQLREKTRRMKIKFKNIKSKGRSFKNVHEQEAYDLSEKIWGIEGENQVEKGNGNEAHEDAKDVKEVVIAGERSVRIGEKPSGSKSTNSLAGSHLLDERKMGVEEREAWKKVGIQEVEAYSRQVEVQSQLFKISLKNIIG